MSVKLQIGMTPEVAVRLRDKIIAGDPDGIALMQSFKVEEIIFHVDGKDVRVIIPPPEKEVKP